jgi:hypothetical protein
LPDIIIVLKTGNMRWARRAEFVEEIKIQNKILVIESLGEKPFRGQAQR